MSQSPIRLVRETIVLASPRRADQAPGRGWAGAGRARRRTRTGRFSRCLSWSVCHRLAAGARILVFLVASFPNCRLGTPFGKLCFPVVARNGVSRKRAPKQEVG